METGENTMTDFLKLESGDYLLQESGSKIILEQTGPPTPTTVVVKKKLSAGWFAIPQMRKEILKPGRTRIYASDIMNAVRG